MKEKIVLLFMFLLVSITSFSQIVIEMEEEGGVYKVPCKVNGLKLKFIFDTGASAVSISSAVAEMMLENDYLDEGDILGNGYSQIADGKIVEHTRIKLRKIDIGGQILHNVEAIVMHQQKAPLLLGQSAIQRLGKVSISNNKLIIQNYSSSKSHKPQVYSDEEYDNMNEQAINFLSKGDNVSGIEIFDILYQHGRLELLFLTSYAYALGAEEIGRAEEGIEILLSHEDELISIDNDSKCDYYDNISDLAYKIPDYELSLKYAHKAKSTIPFPIQKKFIIVDRILRCNKKLGNVWLGINELKNHISEYLKYMEISATDCWDKEYKDKHLGMMYFLLALSCAEVSSTDPLKYSKIAAAWGYPDAIEFLNEHSISYTSKPKEYVY